MSAPENNKISEFIIFQTENSYKGQFSPQLLQEVRDTAIYEFATAFKDEYFQYLIESEFHILGDNAYGFTTFGDTEEYNIYVAFMEDAADIIGTIDVLTIEEQAPTMTVEAFEEAGLDPEEEGGLLMASTKIKANVSFVKEGIVEVLMGNDFLSQVHLEKFKRQLLFNVSADRYFNKPLENNKTGIDAVAEFGGWWRSIGRATHFVFKPFQPNPDFYPDVAHTGEPVTLAVENFDTSAGVVYDTFNVYEKPDLTSRVVTTVPYLTLVEVHVQGVGENNDFFGCEFYNLPASLTSISLGPTLSSAPGSLQAKVTHTSNDLVVFFKDKNGIIFFIAPELTDDGKLQLTYVEDYLTDEEKLAAADTILAFQENPLEKFAEGYILGRHLRPTQTALTKGYFAEIESSSDWKAPPINVTSTDFRSIKHPTRVKGDIEYPGGIGLLERDVYRTKVVLSSEEAEHFEAAHEGSDTYSFDWITPYDLAVCARGLRDIVKYFNVNLDFTHSKIDIPAKQIRAILKVLFYGSVRISKAREGPLTSTTVKHEYWVDVPMRHIEALQSWDDLFVYDSDLDEDVIALVGNNIVTKTLALDALFAQLEKTIVGAVLTGADAEGMDEALPFSAPAVAPEYFPQLITSEAKLRDFALIVRTMNNKIIRERKLLAVKKTFSTAFHFKDFDERLANLTKVLKDYDRKADDARLTIHLEEPLHVLADIGKYLEEDFKSDIGGLLEANKNLYKIAFPARDMPLKASEAKTDDIIEFGFDQKFRLIYILFNGFPLTIGASHVCERANDNVAHPPFETHMLLQRYPEIMEDTQPPYREAGHPPEVVDFAKKYFPRCTIVFEDVFTPLFSLSEVIYEPPAEPAISTRDDVVKREERMDDPEVVVNKYEKSMQEIDDIRSEFFKTDWDKVLKKLKTLEDVYDTVMNIVPFDILLNEALACSFSDLKGANLQETLINMLFSQFFKKDDWEKNKEKNLKIIKEIVDVAEAGAECTMAILAALFVIKGATSEEIDNVIKDAQDGVLGADRSVVTEEGELASGEFDADFFVAGMEFGETTVPFFDGLPTGLPDGTSFSSLYAVIEGGSPLYGTPGVSASIPPLQVLAKGDLLLKKGEDGAFYEVEVVKGSNVGLGATSKVYVPKDKVIKTSAPDLGIIGNLNEFVQLKLMSDIILETEDYGTEGKVEFLQVRHVDKNINPDLFGKTGFIKRSRIKPLSQLGEEQLLKADEGMYLTLTEAAGGAQLDEGHPSSDATQKYADGNDVTTWQKFLVSQGAQWVSGGTLYPYEPSDFGEFDIKTYKATLLFGGGDIDGVFWSGTPILESLFDSQPEVFNPLKEGKVTKGAFRYFERQYMLEFAVRPDGVLLADIEGGFSPLTSDVLGHATYAPPGFFDLGPRAPGPCDDLYIETVKKNNELEILRTLLDSGRLDATGEVEKEAKDLLTRYVQCMEQQGINIFGNFKTALYNRAVTNEEIYAQDAYDIVLKEGMCEEKKGLLAQSLDPDFVGVVVPVEGAASALETETLLGATATVRWPGRNNATDEQIAAYDAWQTCIREQQNKVRDEVGLDKVAAGSPAGSDNNDEASTNELIDSLPSYKLPTTFDEAYILFAQQGIIPINMELRPDAAARFGKLFSGTSACTELAEQGVELVIAILEKEMPEIVKPVKALVTAFKASIQLYMTTKSTIDSLGQTYKNLSLPGIPKFPTSVYQKQLKKIFMDMLEDAARELVLGLVKEILAYIRDACSQKDAFEDPNSSLTADLTEAFLQNPDANAMMDALFNNFDKILGGTSGPVKYSKDMGHKLDAQDVVSLILEGLTRKQICTIINGNASEDLRGHIVHTLRMAYPSYASIFNYAFITEIFLIISKVVGPGYCMSGELAPIFVSEDPYCPDDSAPPFSSVTMGPYLEDYLQGNIEDAASMLQSILDAYNNPNNEGNMPDPCEIAKKAILTPTFLRSIELMVASILRGLQDKFDNDIATFIPRVRNLEEEFQKMFDQFSNKLGDTNPTALQEAFGGAAEDLPGVFGLTADAIKDAAASKEQSEYERIAAQFGKAFSGVTRVRIMHKSGKPFVDKVVLIDPDELKEKANEQCDVECQAYVAEVVAKAVVYNVLNSVAKNIREYTLTALGLKLSPYVNDTVDFSELYAAVNTVPLDEDEPTDEPTDATQTGAWMQFLIDALGVNDESEVGAYSYYDVLSMNVSELPLAAGLWSGLVNEVLAEGGYLNDFTLGEAIGLDGSLVGILSAGVGNTANGEEVTEEMFNDTLDVVEYLLLGLKGQALFDLWGVEYVVDTFYQTDNIGVNPATNEAFPELRAELWQTYNSLDAVVSQPTIASDLSIDSGLRVPTKQKDDEENDKLIDYTIIRTSDVSNNYAAEVVDVSDRNKEKILITISSAGAMKRDVLDYIKENIDSHGGVEKYYGIDFISNLIQDNLLNHMNINVAADNNKMKEVAQSLFEEMTEDALRNSIKIAYDSEFFDANKFADLTLTTTLKQINDKCEGIQIDIGTGNPSKSLFNVDKILEIILNTFKKNFNPCLVEGQKAIKDATAQGLLIALIRVLLVENLLKGVFLAGSVDLQKIMKDSFVRNFLFKRFIKKIKGFGVYDICINLAKAFFDTEKRENKIGFDNKAPLGSLKKLFMLQIKETVTTFRQVTGNTKLETPDNVFVGDSFDYVFATKNDDPLDPEYAVDREAKLENLIRAKYFHNKSFYYQKYFKITMRRNADNEFILDRFVNKNATIQEVGSIPYTNYMNQDVILGAFAAMREKLAAAQGGSLMSEYILTNKEIKHLFDGFQIPNIWDLLGFNDAPEYKEAFIDFMRYLFGFKAGVVLNAIYATEPTFESVEALQDGSWDASKLGWLDDDIIAHNYNYNLKIKDKLDDEDMPEELVGQIFAEGKKYNPYTYLFPVKIVERDIATDVPAFLFSTVDPIMYWAFGGQAVGDVDPALIAEYSNIIENSIGKFDILRKEVEGSLEYASMKTIVPIERYLGFVLIFLNAYMDEKKNVNNLFASTEAYIIYLLRNLKMGAPSPSVSVSNPATSSLSVMNQMPDEKNMLDVLAGFILKMLITTPLFIVKGVAEVADPNIILTKQIFDAMDMITKMSMQIALIATKAGYDIWKAGEEAANEAEASVTGEDPKPVPEFAEWYKEATGLDLPDPSVGIPWQAAWAMAPLISLGLLPSSLPFGVGFPPPVMFGPGIGPPMTPFAIPYLAFGLIKEGDWGGGDQGSDSEKSLC